MAITDDEDSELDKEERSHSSYSRRSVLVILWTSSTLMLSALNQSLQS
jgi:hypothetical protein